MYLCSCVGVFLFILYCLPVTTAPVEIPESVEGRAISATEAIVQWLPLSQSNIDGYQVKYWMNHEDSKGGTQSVLVPSSEKQIRLEGLKANSHYLIEVRAYNSAGYGPPSERLQIHTKKAPPSQPPIIKSQTLKGQSIHIVWERVEPLDNEAPADGYKVLYKQQDNSSGILFTTTRHYIQLPLPANGSYVVEIRAFTEGGDGPVARIQNTAPSEAPESVAARVISATEAIVQWLPLSQSNIDGYQVRYWMNHEDSEGAQSVMVTSSRNQTILEGLKANSHYLIEVQAYNSAGYGPPSERLQIHTKKAPPSQPPIIKSQTLKGQSIHIVWECAEPLDNEAPADGYKVLYKQQDNSSGILYTTTRHYIQLPLPANGSYVVEIQAFTEGGDGPVARIQNTEPGS